MRRFIILSLLCLAVCHGEEKSVKTLAATKTPEIIPNVATADIHKSEDTKKVVARAYEAVKPEDPKKKLKVAIFVPYMANSQILWNKRVGEELMEAGHDVTLYMLHMFEHNITKVDIDDRIRVEHVNGSYGMNGTEMLQMQAEMAFNDLAVWDSRMRIIMSQFEEMRKSCKLFIRNETFLNHIRESKFDVAFAHMYNFCNIGIIHQTKIPTWIWLNSGALMDNVASLMGVPLPPSYCTPAMMEAGANLNFVERVKSFIGHSMFSLMWKKMMADSETAYFREVFGEDFPDLVDIAKKAPLVMVNSNELYDFARPTLAKIVNVGGVGIKAHNVKPLKPEFASRVDAAKHIIVMSYGSFAPMYLMPDQWKEAYFHTFAQFPDVQFFLRYEYPEEIADHLPNNAFAAKWLPQSDLLQNPKAIGLISHGGYNSIQDAIHAGVPIITTGLFGDQHRNAFLVERLGMGINLHKTRIHKETVEAAVRRVVEDQSLITNARKLRAMVATKPVSAETLLVKYTEFLAEHKTLDNLVPEGANMGLFVYHSLDVILFLSIIVLTILTLIFLCLRFTFRKCCKKFCSKNEDKTKKNN